MAAEAKQLDDTIEIVTPENIAFEYRAAGPFRRFLAYVLDYIIRSVIIVGVFLFVVFLFATALCSGLVPFVAPVTVPAFLILFFIVTWFYGGLFEAYWNGQTPGKRLLGIRVLTDEGKPINGMQAIMRNILRSADELPVITPMAFPWMRAIIEEINPEIMELPLYIIPTFVFALIVMSTNRRFQRIGDIVCGTMVLVEERQWLTGAVKLEDPRAAQLAEYIPANFVVTRTMARAIASYADRRRFFSPARRREVARHLAEPLLRLFQLPADTSHDLLLCALYHRTFVLASADDRLQAPRPLPAANVTTTPAFGR